MDRKQKTQIQTSDPSLKIIASKLGKTALLQSKNSTFM
jgi:hypothetical protein